MDSDEGRRLRSRDTPVDYREIDDEESELSPDPILPLSEPSTAVNPSDITSKNPSDYIEKKGKTYRCKFPGCIKTTNDRSNMNKHVLEKHIRTKFQCSYCPQTFPTINAQQAHQRKSHAKEKRTKVEASEKIKCQFCAKVIGKKHNYFTHLKSVHKIADDRLVNFSPDKVSVDSDNETDGTDRESSDTDSYLSGFEIRELPSTSRQESATKKAIPKKPAKRICKKNLKKTGTNSMIASDIAIINEPQTEIKEDTPESDSHTVSFHSMPLLFDDATDYGDFVTDQIQEEKLDDTTEATLFDKNTSIVSTSVSTQSDYIIIKPAVASTSAAALRAIMPPPTTIPKRMSSGAQTQVPLISLSPGLPTREEMNNYIMEDGVNNGQTQIKEANTDRYMEQSATNALQVFGDNLIQEIEEASLAISSISHAPILIEPLKFGKYARDTIIQLINFDRDSERWNIVCSSFILMTWGFADIGTQKRINPIIVTSATKTASFMENFVGFMEGSFQPPCLNDLLDIIQLGVCKLVGCIHGALYLYDSVLKLSIEDACALYLRTHNCRNISKFERHVILASALVKVSLNLDTFLGRVELYTNLPSYFLADLFYDKDKSIEEYTVLKDLAALIKSNYYNDDSSGYIRYCLSKNPIFPSVAKFITTYIQDRALGADFTNLELMVGHSRKFKDGTITAVRLKNNNCTLDQVIHAEVLRHFAPDFVNFPEFNEDVVTVENADATLSLLYNKFLDCRREGVRFEITAGTYILLCGLKVANAWDVMFSTEKICNLINMHDRVTLFKIAVFSNNNSVISYFIFNFDEIFTTEQHRLLFVGFNSRYVTSTVDRMRDIVKEIDRYLLLVYWSYMDAELNCPELRFIEANEELKQKFALVSHVLDLKKLKQFRGVVIPQKFILSHDLI